MPSKLVPYSYILHTRCPNCKKEVDAVKINNSNSIGGFEKPPYRRHVYLLGCPECSNVYYKLDTD